MLSNFADGVPPDEVDLIEDDLDRILALEKRPPLDTRWNSVRRRYEPKAAALVRVMTNRLGRGKRVSCACRPRIVTGEYGGIISVVRVMPEGILPEPPKLISVADFVKDNQANADEITTADRVAKLRPGETIRLPAADDDEAGGHFCIDTLNAIQAWALYEIPIEAGGFGLIGVGAGKSLMMILLPIALGAECELAVLLMEPNQRRHYVSQYKRVREHFATPSIIFEDGTPPFIVPGAPQLHTLPYSKLSNPRTPDELGRLNPNVILADEAHRLTGKAATTGRSRVKGYMKRKIHEREQRIAQGLPVHKRAVYFVPVSGTLEDKSVEDTQAVAAYALGKGSPLPIDPAEATKWARVFDPVRMPDRTSTTACRLQMAFAGKLWGAGDISTIIDGHRPEKALWEGYQRRRAETPGVISAPASEVGASLVFKKPRMLKMPAVVAEALRKVREEGIRPDGEIIVGDSENNVEAAVKIVSKQVACGLFLYWAFPKVQCSCNGQDPRCDGCKLIADWYMKRKRFAKPLRVRLLDPLPHLDSPKLCKNAAIRALEDTSAPAGLDVYCADCRQAWPCGKATHMPAWRVPQWKEWGEIEDKVPHEERVKWVGADLPEAQDDATHPGYYLVRDTVKYAQEKPAVLWFATVGLGEKIAQLAKLPYHGGGPKSEALIRKEKGDRSIIASMRAHGKGLDGLQLRYADQLIVEMMSSNRIMEQLLGRMVRRGQKQDTVYTSYYAHVVEFREALRRVKARAEFNQAMLGQPSLILAADFEDDD